mmetsp:Transcript_1063/g.3304  ORF Transcript_1063/g.3304 Transcript_1063/m.3304 type:complete len:250 (-) Transcript_1063:570-1319(-)|eukprot:CAMPEP_0198726312 /NCGR_PEP_ID=MMETSP1475-20131203/3403_1 /TAXON_ID= ORGANISM="Unidentified sp., Strain CCMP1999" /NCGR_SAMPLE_ID=MMETSP1475 /ASSEMBLY_ACC=CAM_ASM_001111 /LENGTH=249 /DNA_ID=CAMNT_0044488219 /DNA_START=62 /DNA_END=811 /DNA_ORIENTATION=+
MSTWLQSNKLGEGWSYVDRGDADGLRAWLERLGDDTQREKALRAKDEDGRTLLHGAASRGDQRMVETLLDFNAPVDGSDEAGTTVLHSACGCGSEGIVKLILEVLPKQMDDVAARKFVRKKTDTGIVSLHYAAGRGSVSLIRMLVEAGANVNANDKFGNTPLFRAVGKNKDEAVAVLLELGADAEKQNAAGDNVMHMACENGNDRIVRMLVNSAGFDLFEAKNRDEKTPLDIVDRQYRPQLVAFLEGGG